MSKRRRRPNPAAAQLPAGGAPASLAAPAPTKAAAPRRARLVQAALLCALTLLAYLPALRGDFIWDDRVLLTENAMVHAPDGLYRFWFTTEAYDYWPLTASTFWVEWRLWGLDATGYHATNLVLHAVEALLLWAILARLGAGGAYLAALLFAVHPANVESVAWIAQRKNLTAMLFLELALLAWLKAVPDTPSARDRDLSGLKRRDYLVSLGLFVLAMLGKGSAAVLPLLLLLLAWWRRGRVTVRDGVRVLPFVAVAVPLTLVNVWLQARMGPVRDADVLERLLGAGAVVWFYLGKALLPLGLAFVYPQWRIDAGDPRWWLPALAAVAFTLLLWRLRRTRWRPLLAAWLFFVIALLPVMGLTDVHFMKYSLVADHYQHLALAGIAALVAAVWNGWQRRHAHTAAVAAAVAVGALVLLTRAHAATYKDEETLYRATIATSPSAWLAHYNLAVMLGAEGRGSEALDLYREALRLKPDLSVARANLGLLLQEQGRPEEAVVQLQEASRLEPGSARVQYNLGQVLAASGRLDEAIGHYETALRIKPDDPEACAALALALAHAGRVPQAIAGYRRALQLKPDLPDAHYNLATLLSESGARGEALDHYREALRLRPAYAEAHNNLAIALSEQGRPQDALAHFLEAVRLKPGFFDARMNLVRTYARLGKRADAVSGAQAALAAARSAGDQAWQAQFAAWLARSGAR